jgi:hypothetical protein
MYLGRMNFGRMDFGRMDFGRMDLSRIYKKKPKQLPFLSRFIKENFLSN